MKKINLWVLAGALVFVGACNKSEIVPQPPVTEIGELADDLQFLREEEKLARDVYMFAAQLYPSAVVFNNIAASEQKHMDRTLTLLQLYDLTDPAAGKPAGSFVNQDLQQLYGELTERASLSLADALWVGATIEDLDISDIKEMLAAPQLTVDLIALYESLSCGSRNHLRSFTNQLAAQGQIYEPQFLSLEAYQAILAGSHEQCN